MIFQADVNADMDHFKDTDRQEALKQKLDQELNAAPWNKDTSHQALEEMEKISKTVKPVYEGFWKRNDEDILSRLDETAKKLKNRRVEMKRDINEEAHQQGDQVPPSDRSVTCKCLME